MGAWRIGLAALEEAVLRPLPGKADDGLKESFAKRAGVYLPDAGGFEEQLIEAYNIQLIKEEGYIYATAKEQENTYEKSLRIILELFQGKNSRKAIPESGNRIYDGVAYLCSQMNYFHFFVRKRAVKHIPFVPQRFRICFRYRKAFMALHCTVGNLTFTIVKNLASFRGMNTMEYTVQSAVYDRLFNLPESFFRKYDAADLALRAMGISNIFNILADVLVNSLFSAVFSLLYLWRMFRICTIPDTFPIGINLS